MDKTAASGGCVRCSCERGLVQGGAEGQRDRCTRKETGWCGEGRLTANGCGRLIVADRGCLWPGASGDDGVQREVVERSPPRRHGAMDEGMIRDF